MVLKPWHWRCDTQMHSVMKTALLLLTVLLTTISSRVTFCKASVLQENHEMNTDSVETQWWCFFSPPPSKMFFCVINTLKMMILINIWWQGKKERLRCGDVAISEDQIPRSKSLLIHIILRKTWKYNLDRGKHQYFCSYLLSTFPPHEAVGPCLGILGVGKLDSLSSRNKASLQHASSSTIRNEIHGRLQSNWADTS